MSKQIRIRGKTLKWWRETAILATCHPGLVSLRAKYNIERYVNDKLSLFGRYNYPYHIIFLAGMSSGSTLMKNLLSRIPGYYTRYMPMPYDVQYMQNICDSAFNNVPQKGYALFKTHLNPSKDNVDCLFRNGVEKVLVTYQDFRDIAVSRYYRLMVFPKERGAHDFVDYEAMGKEKAIDHSIEVVASGLIPWINGWLERAREYPERYHFTKFEDLKKDTHGEYRKILSFYGIDFPDDKIKGIVDAAKGKGNNHKNLITSRLVPWGYSSNFRSGTSGHWRMEMTPAQIDKSKELLGSALIELEYEKDLDW